MRTTTAPELVLLHGFQRSEAAKIEIIRNNVAVDVSNRVLGASWSLSSDHRVSDGSVVFEDNYSQYDITAALNPLVSTSSFNTPTSLVWANNDIKIYVGVDDLGSDASDDLKLVFHGVLGDAIDPSYAPGDRKLKIQFRDLSKRLQNKPIIGEFVYGDDDGTAAVAVIQSILNDCFTAEVSSSDYKKLHVDSSAYTNCNLVVYPMKIGNMSCWDAINKVIGCAANDDMGFELRYKFIASGAPGWKDNEGGDITITADGFYLCLLQIDQSNTTPDDIFSASADEVYNEDISISDDMIRNSVYVKYVDRDTKEAMTIHRDDQSSIAIYGQIDMIIGQDDVPFIDTYVEAWDLAGVALNALKGIYASDSFTCQLGYQVEPNDLISVANAQLYTGTDVMSITDIVFNIAPGGGASTKQGFTMKITGVRDAVTGSRLAFLNMTGNNTLIYSLPPKIGDAEGSSTWGRDEKGNANTKTVLTCQIPPNIQLDWIEWRYAVEGDDIWKVEITTEPELTIMGLPPGKVLAYFHRFKLQGGAR